MTTSSSIPHLPNPNLSSAEVEDRLSAIVSDHVAIAAQLIAAAGLRDSALRVAEYERKCHSALSDLLNNNSTGLGEAEAEAEEDVYGICRAEARTCFSEARVVEGVIALSSKLRHAQKKAGTAENSGPVQGQVQAQAAAEIEAEAEDETAKSNPVLSYLASYFTFFRWWSPYKISWLRGDSIAAITVWFMLIPQGMAYSSLAGLPPIHGLYNTLIPLFVYPFFGTSRELVLGPTAIVSLFTGQILGHIAAPSDPMYAPLAHALGFCCGLVVLLVGMLKLGFVLESLLSRPLLHGFVNGAALIISISQAKHLFGLVGLPQTNELVVTLTNIISRIGDVNWWTFMYGCICLFLMWGLKKLWKHLPASFIVMLVATLVAFLADLNTVWGMLVVGDVPQGLPVPVLLTGLTSSTLGKLMTAAAEISLLIAIESISICKTLSGRHKPPYATGADQELFAAGAANMLTSLLQGFPVAGSFSRSAVNFVAGSHTPFSGWITTVGVILSLVVLTPLFKFIPNVVLGAVVIYAALKLLDFSEMKLLWRLSKLEFAQSLVCFVVTLFFGAELGVLSAVGLSLAGVVYRSARPSLIELERLQGTTLYRNVAEYPKAVLSSSDSIVVLKHDAPLYFANIANFTEALQRVADRRWPSEGGSGGCCGVGQKRRGGAAVGVDIELQAVEVAEVKTEPEPEPEPEPKTRTIVIDGAQIKTMDLTAIHQLHTSVEALRKRNIQVLWVQATASVRRVMGMCEFGDVMGRAAFFSSVHEAVLFAMGGGVAQPDVKGDDEAEPEAEAVNAGEESEVE